VFTTIPAFGPPSPTSGTAAPTLPTAVAGVDPAVVRAYVAVWPRSGEAPDLGAPNGPPNGPPR
jgi:hypothetical protein